MIVEYEKYYPKGKKEIPKENNQKSESKGMCGCNFRLIESRGHSIQRWNSIRDLRVMCWILVLTTSWKMTPSMISYRDSLKTDLATFQFEMVQR